jgi:hypothetical protein
MDVALVALMALLVLALVLGVRWNSKPLSRPGYEYQRVFSVGAAGLLFFVSGLIGWDLSHSHGWFQGTKWAEGPIWWEAAVGLGLLLLAGVWARRVSHRPAIKRG